MRSLSWGGRYLAVRPDHFRVAYSINPFMDPTVQPDPARALRQWEGLVEAVQDSGAQVDVLAQGPEVPDMVFAMNLGLVLGERVVLSHMRYAERRPETPLAKQWFRDAGFTPLALGAGTDRPHLEAGDVFAYAGGLVAGFGPRTEEAALAPLATALDARVRGFRIVHPSMYHLDLAFCPLDEEAAMVCPAALDAPSAAALLALVPDPLVLTEEEALGFCANSVVVGRTVVMPDCPDRVRRWLESRGFTVRLVELSEFHKAGGSARCLTNPLDVRPGRDLPVVPGGEVVLPGGSLAAA